MRAIVVMFVLAPLALAQSAARLELTRVASFPVAGGRVRSADLSADGLRFVTLGEDGRVVVRDHRAARVVAELAPVPTGFVESVFVDGGESVLLRDRRGALRRWRVAAGTCELLPGIEAPVFGLAALDGRRFATLHDAGNARRIVCRELRDDGRAHEIARHLVSRLLPTRLRADAATHGLLAIADDGDAVALDLDRPADALRARSVQAPTEVPEPQTRDDVTLTVPRRGGVVIVRAGVRTPFADHRGDAQSVAFSPDGRFVAVAGGAAVVGARADDGTVVDVVAGAVEAVPAITGPEFWFADEHGASRWNAAVRRTVGRRVDWPHGLRAQAPADGARVAIALCAVGDESVLAVLADADDEAVLVKGDCDRSREMSCEVRGPARQRVKGIETAAFDRLHHDVAYSAAEQRAFVHARETSSPDAGRPIARGLTWTMCLERDEGLTPIAGLGALRSVLVDRRGKSVFVVDHLDRVLRRDVHDFAANPAWAESVNSFVTLGVQRLLAVDQGVVLALADLRTLVGLDADTGHVLARNELVAAADLRRPNRVTVIAAAPDGTRVAYAPSRGIVEIVAVKLVR